jgi:DNA-binding PadR family transcriptional regulator
MAEIKVNNILKLYVLLLLNDKSRYGYELIKGASARLGRNIGAGQIYPFLKELQKRGIVRASPAGTREKKIYSLTTHGRRFVLSMVSRFGELISLSIKPRLSVCAHCGCKVYEGGYEERIGGKTFRFCCPHCAKDFHGR